MAKKLEFGKKLFATFYKSSDDFGSQLSPNDFDFATPKKQFIENDYSNLYNNIYARMKLMNGDSVRDFPKKDRPLALKQLEIYKTDKSKQEFLIEYVMPMLRFELLRPKVKLFIDEYIKNNPEYKCVRVFCDEINSDNKNTNLLHINP